MEALSIGSTAAAAGSGPAAVSVLAQYASLTPMLATPGSMPTGNDWTYEIKWDGMRTLAYVGADAPGGLLLKTRNGNDVTSRYPDLRGLADAVPKGAMPLILDGEIVAFDEHGVPDFAQMQRRMHVNGDLAVRIAANEVPVHFAIFDVVAIAGKVVCDLPYNERRELLHGLGLSGERWSVPQGYTDGEALLDEVTARGIEGVVAKLDSGRYTPGRRAGTWIKVKRRPRQEFVIGGWTEGAGNRSGSFGSVLVGAYDRPGGTLRFFGSVGSGFGDEMLGLVKARLQDLAQSEAPFERVEPRLRHSHWVRPELVAEIEYQELTSDGRLRQPSFKGLRNDKPAADVVFEGRDVRPSSTSNNS